MTPISRLARRAMLRFLLLDAAIRARAPGSDIDRITLDYLDAVFKLLGC